MGVCQRLGVRFLGFAERFRLFFGFASKRRTSVQLRPGAPLLSSAPSPPQLKGADTKDIPQEWDRLRKRPMAQNPHYWMEAKKRFRAALGKVTFGWTQPRCKARGASSRMSRCARSSGPEVHSKMFPYSCSSCSVKTRLLLQLWHHELRRLAQRLCRCHRCGLMCHVRENLRYHLAKAHGQNHVPAPDPDRKLVPVCTGEFGWPAAPKPKAGRAKPTGGQKSGVRKPKPTEANGHSVNYTAALTGSVESRKGHWCHLAGPSCSSYVRQLSCFDSLLKSGTVIIFSLVSVDASSPGSKVEFPS
ncbi:uncharacterized protein LOC115308879 isoform X1 [Ixodes scapularis]|uniref:uncharacterized protein LOC115308879 isoform X1 n=1 Tax=Ixodes scapularis TaxID=6945 RepID=UPI001A9DC36F|nr:uncharacterized protein LOC115308879 isoform X1 [Ixodes scapularis]